MELLNAVFLLIGGAFIGVGIYIHVKLDEYVAFLENANLNDIHSVFIVIGVIIWCVAFFGGFGVRCKNMCMIKSYAIFLSIILLSLIVGTVVIIVFEVPESRKNS